MTRTISTLDTDTTTITHCRFQQQRPGTNHPGPGHPTLSSSRGLEEEIGCGRLVLLFLSLLF